MRMDLGVIFQTERDELKNLLYKERVKKTKYDEYLFVSTVTTHKIKHHDSHQLISTRQTFLSMISLKEK